MGKITVFIATPWGTLRDNLLREIPEVNQIGG
jgi:hypothetical protein